MAASSAMGPALIGVTLLPWSMLIGATRPDSKQREEKETAGKENLGSRLEQNEPTRIAIAYSFG